MSAYLLCSDGVAGVVAEPSGRPSRDTVPGVPVANDSPPSSNSTEPPVEESTQSSPESDVVAGHPPYVGSEVASADQ